ncbi:MAG: hypothetical protein JNK72_13470 [Myxococcales bacterium]|nr:hypothetical protein [Myxococcales bacterium]
MRQITRFLFTLSCLALSASAAADPVSPVSLSVSPVPNSFLWRVGVQNTSPATVPVVFDRRLVWFEVAPPVTAPGPGVRRPRRAARPVRCAHEARPANNERSPEVVLPAGEGYSELVDVRDVCRLRLPAGFVEGATLTVHYGFVTPPARPPRRPRPVPLSRSVVRDERREAFGDLTATVVVQPLPVSVEVTTAPSATLSGLNLRGRGNTAQDGMGLRAAMRLQNPSIQPVSTLFRSTLFSFEVTPPGGAPVRCNLITRGPSVQRDFFVRLGGYGSRATTLVPHFYCPGTTFDTAGVYEVVGVFESLADGAAFHLGRVFVGTARSTPFQLRVVRGRGPYAPMRPLRSAS